MRPCEAPCLKERDVIGLVNLSNSQMRHKQIKKRRRRIKPLQSSCSSSWSSRDESLRSAARLRLLAVHPRVTVHIKNARNNLRCAGRRRGERISQFSKDEAAAQKDSETERDAVQTSSCKKKRRSDCFSAQKERKKQRAAHLRLQDFSDAVEKYIISS